MLRLRKPSPELMRSFLKSQSLLDFSYTAVKGTAHAPPSGFVVDHTRVSLGRGAETFAQAKAALRSWKHFELGWVYVWPTTTELETGNVVSVVAHCCGLWLPNAARIVYTIDEPARFGFAYGTLPGHVESGEERFSVEIAADETVVYDILAFSRPNWWLAKIGYPVVRHLQKRFARDSAKAMHRAIG